MMVMIVSTAVPPNEVMSRAASCTGGGPTGAWVGPAMTEGQQQFLVEGLRSTLQNLVRQESKSPHARHDAGERQ